MGLEEKKKCAKKLFMKCVNTIFDVDPFCIINSWNDGT